MNRLFALLFAVAIAGSSGIALARPKTDRVWLLNGDVLQGEVKELSGGSLTYKTDSASTIYIDWVDVLRLTSEFEYEVELKSGGRLLGALADATADGFLRVSESAGPAEVKVHEVVGLRAIDSSWRERMDSDVSLGFSYARSTDLGSLDFSAGTIYNGPTWETNARLDSSFTVQRKADTQSQRHSFFVQPRRFFREIWFVFGSTGFENNSELELDARVVVGAGPGIRVLNTGIQFLSFQTGAVFNEEWYSSSDSGRSSAEAVFAATYSIFKRKSPKTTLELSGQYFAGFTEGGRSRAKGDVRFRQEVITDFFIELSSFVTYDSQPEGEDVEETDVGITTSFGYTF